MSTKINNEAPAPRGAGDVARALPDHEEIARRKRKIDSTPAATTDQRAAKVFKGGRGPTGKGGRRG